MTTKLGTVPTSKRRFITQTPKVLEVIEIISHKANAEGQSIDVFLVSF